MKLLGTSFEFDYCPFIPTEEVIHSLLLTDCGDIPDDFYLFKFPISHIINTKGIEYVNRLLEEYSIDNGSRIIICQHIMVDQLAIKENDLVFTPHASENNGFFSIPHYAVNYSEVTQEKEKGYLFSFLGSVTTHPVRNFLVNRYPNFCFSSGVHWGLDTGNGEDFRRKYIDLLSNSFFSLCPRGTGISSVRIFESMASGSFPVFIADGYKPPLNLDIDWDRISVSVGLEDLDNLEELLRKSKKKMDREYMDFVYRTNLSNRNLHISVKKEIEKLIENGH